MPDPVARLNGLALVAPRITPVLDPQFRPAVLTNRAFRALARAAGHPVPVSLVLEQADGSRSGFHTEVLPADHPEAAGDFAYVERLLKFLLWSRGGYKIYFAGPRSIGEALQRYYRETPTGMFDANVMGDRVYEQPFEVVVTRAEELPKERASAAPLGRHLDGCRIGFDLGGSDRKVAAVVDGEVVFSEEIAWNPVPQKDPQYHVDGIQDSLTRAAGHLPRVDAIGGSAAGIYVNNRVKIASLFRGIPPDVFKSRVRDLFLEVSRAWPGVPFDVVNDGEVTALAGSMAMSENAVLGVAMGTSQAAGYVTPEGNITTWLNELAFVPVDYHPAAARDEWSGDIGCGALYFSQQCVGRLLAPAGIEVDAAMPLPEKLNHVQVLMAAGDARARKIYETIGTYLGYTMAHYADFYDYRYLLLLGRVTTGTGGDVILAGARAVLEAEFPELAGRVRFHTPGEKEKRHGQAIAAASLPSR